MPEEKEKHVNPILMFLGFSPFIVYWVLVGNVSYHLAVVISFIVAALIFATTLIQHRSVKFFEVCVLVLFLGLLIATFATNDLFLARWIQPISIGALFLAMLATVAVGRPFTAEYDRDFVSPEQLKAPYFMPINRVVTLAWVVACGLMTAFSCIPPIVQGKATIHDGGTELSIICYWVIPIVLFVLAIIFSDRYPWWYLARWNKRMGEDQQS